MTNNNQDKDKALEDYRKTREQNGYSAEEMFEMRAAFGEGVEVVDIFTGKTITT